MDKLDEKISSLVKPLNDPIEDEFTEKVLAAISRRHHLRQTILILATFGGLVVALAPITRLMVAVSVFLFGAPSEIPGMMDIHGAVLSALVCAVMLFLTRLMRNRFE